MAAIVSRQLRRIARIAFLYSPILFLTLCVGLSSVASFPGCSIDRAIGEKPCKIPRRPGTSGTSQEKKVPLQLTLASPEPKQFVLILTNSSTIAIDMNAELLNPILLCSVDRCGGEQVPTLPPPVPGGRTANRLVVLRPHESISIRFSLAEILDASLLAPGAYLIGCSYPGSLLRPQGSDSGWSAKAESNRLAFTVP